MRLIQHYAAVAAELRICYRLAHQRAVGHELYAGLARRAVIESDGVAHLAARQDRP